jgi:hypothetical protein
VTWPSISLRDVNSGSFQIAAVILTATVDSNNIKMSNYIAAFKEKIQAKPFEQISLLLFDVNNCEQVQKDLLERILFVDAADPTYWSDYVNHAITAFPEKKLQLQRLVNKAIEKIDETLHRDHEGLLSLHLASASLKRYD